MAATIELRRLLRCYEEGMTVRRTASIVGLPPEEVHTIFGRFYSRGLPRKGRKILRRDFLRAPRYRGPEWIGEPNGNPPLPSGPDWIGTPLTR